jgi:hypothetical protein
LTLTVHEHSASVAGVPSEKVGSGIVSPSFATPLSVATSEAAGLETDERASLASNQTNKPAKHRTAALKVSSFLFIAASRADR